MFSSRNKKNNVYPCKPQFYYIKVGLKGSKLYSVCFRDENYRFGTAVGSNNHRGLVLNRFYWQNNLHPKFI